MKVAHLLFILLAGASACDRVQGQSPGKGPSVQASEDLAGGGHVTGGDLSIDVQIGNPVRHGVLSNGRESAESAVLERP